MLRVLALIIVGWLALVVRPAQSTPLELYMATDGSDKGNCTQSSPCLTLGRIQAVVKAKNPQDSVTVNVALGTYRGQTMNGWATVMPTHTISFVGAGSGTSDIPVFDNCTDDANLSTCTHNVWFKLLTSAGHNGGADSNLVFDHLEITHYGQPIWLVGDMNDAANGWNGGNVVENCVFEDDGNFYAPALGFSYSTIAVTNSRGNLITGNLFEHIHSAGLWEGYLHAVYVGNFSSDNIVSGNSFIDVGGDTIRFRDASNYNDASGNYFSQTGIDAPLTSWFCHYWQNGECEGQIEHEECPSVGNIADSDTYTGNETCTAVVPFQRNLYGANVCGIPLKKQNVAVTRLTTNLPRCGQ